MKFKQLLGLLVLGASVGSIGSMNTASAKTKWHKGTPTAIRGTWVSKTNAGMRVIGKPWKGMARLHISKNYFSMYFTKEPVSDHGFFYHPYYHHKIGTNVYYLRASGRWRPAGFYTEKYVKTYSYEKYTLTGDRIDQHNYGFTNYYKQHGKIVNSTGFVPNVKQGVAPYYKLK